MKDIERIQSTELAVQVADANPGNFAIEQEVAQLVGATVPAPTEPSADDARELGAQLLVFLRRALLPIRSALRTALAAIYAHLDSRCTDYTPAAYAPFRLPAGPYDPMRPFVPRTLPNLLTAITAFAPRKISNGSATADGIPDGVSLAHLLCSANQVTELVDDNYGWIWNKCVEGYQSFPLTRCFPNAKKMTVNCDSVVGTGGDTYLMSGSNWEEFYAPYAKSYTNTWYSPLFKGCTNLKVIYMPSLDVCSSSRGTDIGQDSTLLRRLVVGKVVGISSDFMKSTSPDLIDIELGQGISLNLNFATWNPTNALSSSASDLVADPTAHPTWKNLDQFLQNFKEHIALRLTDQGSGLTLTLSQAVFSAVIEGASPICDDIKGIIEDKGWKVQDTNNNIFPTT